MRKQIINTLKVSDLSIIERVLYTSVRKSNNDPKQLDILISNLHSNKRSIRQIEYLLIHSLKVKNVSATIKDALYKYNNI